MPKSGTFRKYLFGSLEVVHDLINEMQDNLEPLDDEFIYNSEIELFKELMEELLLFVHEIEFLKQNESTISFDTNLDKNYELTHRKFEKIAKSEADSLFNNMNLKRRPY